MTIYLDFQVYHAWSYAIEFDRYSLPTAMWLDRTQTKVAVLHVYRTNPSSAATIQRTNILLLSQSIVRGHGNVVYSDSHTHLLEILMGTLRIAGTGVNDLIDKCTFRA